MGLAGGDLGQEVEATVLGRPVVKMTSPAPTMETTFNTLRLGPRDLGTGGGQKLGTGMLCVLVSIGVVCRLNLATSTWWFLVNWNLCVGRTWLTLVRAELNYRGDNLPWLH